MKQYINPSRTKWAELCQRPALELEFLEGRVKNILNRVKVSGDEALKELTLQIDNVSLDSLLVSKEEIEIAENQVPEDLKQAIRIAASNISKFHSAQQNQVAPIETMPGVTCWRKATPIEKIGIYVPGGTAPLFSTLLMLAVPAKIAGCQDIILCTPPKSDGSVDPTILFVAKEVGLTQVFKVGGAQAIAAMAYGTATIPPVYKIFGPGNQYVTKAKQLVSMEGLAIDMPAGPSEVLVVADEAADPAFVAADLLSQAEHGSDSQVVLVSTTAGLIESVEKELALQLETLPRKNIAALALQNSLIIEMNKEADIIDFVNTYAPEHLILNTENCDIMAEKITNSGSVFLGQFTPESVGDYASGTNHTLPTNGFAKAYSGVSLSSFQKFITFQKLSKDGIVTLGPVVERMAEAEQLMAHKRAVSIRLRNL
ncbi:MAG TPA: histidinol dehydrogenase [Cyclobacteriaceae bacterium]|nr:histidinol dehydrogenase [Cyclobacteriaceae bacterium]HRK55628.1 histidinol dehydrogenase [Cyclobacteriaceae bacterium]